MTLRLAMWSGPRNISTAMMRAWENRPDCVVIDEPFYACYLATTGIDHPMRREVIKSQSCDWGQVARQLCTDHAKEGIYYQKHMTHHMLPEANLDWTTSLQHCFLIRDPFEVVNSYRQKRSSVSIEDIGIVRQLELYQEISKITGQEIPVIDAGQFLMNPEIALHRLCERLHIPFLDEMLSWPAGQRQSDGVWAAHWYQAVEQSTGFQAHRQRELNLSKDQQSVAKKSEPAYRELLACAAG